VIACMIVDDRIARKIVGNVMIGGRRVIRIYHKRSIYPSIERMTNI
jgi:hypothetical protein